MRLSGALLLLVAGSTWAVTVPSCDTEVDNHCVGPEADLSPEGIRACLTAVADKSERCTVYLTMMEACTADIADGAVCGSAHMDGETMPCLVQRTKPEDLSEACRAALPKDDVKGLAKFWADGKRQLTINEIADLNADDKDTYNRWQKRKKGKKTDKDRERDYAVKQAKRERVTELIKAAVKEAASAGELSIAEAVKVATKEADQALSEDMTGTLKPFSKPELERLAKEALKAAKSAKGEL